MLQFMGSQSWTQLSHRTTTIMHLFLHYKIIQVLKIEETKKSGKDNIYHATSKMLPCGSAGKESTCNAGDLGLIPGLERSPGEGKGYPLQYSGLENSMDCRVHWAKESDTTEQLSQDFGKHTILSTKVQFEYSKWFLFLFFHPTKPFLLSLVPKLSLPCHLLSPLR